LKEAKGIEFKVRNKNKKQLQKSTADVFRKKKNCDREIRITENAVKSHGTQK
jgi:hypothetical protein